jgi:hypothetical protein
MAAPVPRASSAYNTDGSRLLELLVFVPPQHGSRLLELLVFEGPKFDPKETRFTSQVHCR